MNITVVGIGYVGLSHAILLSQKNNVIAYDISNIKVDKINNKISPIEDSEAEDFLKNKDLNLKATSDKHEAFKDADLVIIATPTDYDTENKKFDLALNILNEGESGNFSTQYNELKGDIYVLQGNNNDAKLAYQQAITESESAALDTGLLNIKLNSVD